MHELSATNIFVLLIACDDIDIQSDFRYARFQTVFLVCILLLQVSDSGLTALSRGCPKLRVLHMDECLKVTDAGLQELALGCKELRVRTGHHASR